MYNFIRSEKIPKLSWAFDWDLVSNDLTVYAGVGVEERDGSWVEGAWAGSFNNFEFDRSVLAGSGCQYKNNSIYLIPPFHTYEQIWLVESGKKIYGSNSLAFVLSASGEKLCPSYAFYPERLGCAIKGEGNLQIELPLEGGEARLYALYISQFRYHRYTGLSSMPAATANNFYDYNSYTSVLNKTVETIVENANDPKRRFVYEPTATLSSGYDTTAAACVAKRFGATDAFSIADARGLGNFNGEDDSGALVAEALELNLTSFKRNTSLEINGNFPITEFWASGGSCSEYTLRPLCEAVDGRLLFTGYCGDLYYLSDRESRYQRTDLGGGSLGEIRKRVGFIHLPIPFIGIEQQKTLLNISLSDEMRPWFEGRLYDKPIPRRIAEECGVPRRAFGSTKQSIGSIENRYSINNQSLALIVKNHFNERSTSIFGERWFLFSEVRRIVERFVFNLLKSLRLVNSGHAKVNSDTPKIGYSEVRLNIETVPNLSNFRIRNRTLHGWMGGKAFLWAVELLMEERYSLKELIGRDDEKY
jgi:hypothetical protein